MKCPIPQKCAQVLWDPLRRRYRILYGGRGSAKSWSTARYLLLRASSEKLRILCTREVQNSIKDSVYRLLVDQITELQLQAFFIIKADSIISTTGSEFLFKGLAHNINEIKSTEGIDIVWIEEADRVSENSWTNLIPTIRKPGSIIIVVFNPDDAKSATYTRFIEKEGEDGVVRPVDNPQYCRGFVNYWDNKRFFPDVLRTEMEWDKIHDPEKYEHIWCGRVKQLSEAVIFKGKYEVREFETSADANFLHGADFGFADDPAAGIRAYIEDMTLFIDQETYGHGVEIPELPVFFGKIETFKRWESIADSSRPDTISYLKSHGFPKMIGAEKGPDSVEEGIEWIRGFKKVVIHPRCKNAAYEFGAYKYKQDKITNAVLPIPIDKNNHLIDALRYALEKYMKRKVTIFDIQRAQKAQQARQG